MASMDNKDNNIQDLLLKKLIENETFMILDVFNTCSMFIYVLLNFEHNNDVRTIVKLLYRTTSRRRVAL